MPCVFRMIKTIVMGILLVSQVTGCSTMDGIRGVRDVAKPTEWAVLNPEGKEQYWYDQSIRGYRHDSQLPTSRQLGELVRDQTGKKVQSEDELSALRKAHSSNVMSTGSKVGVAGGSGFWMVAAIAETIILFPCVLAFNVVKDVLVLPFLPIASSLKSTYANEVERAYVNGRREFEAGQYNMALASWARAQELAPSLQSHSDIDYWRGQAFAALQLTNSAALSFAAFLSYSDSSVPEYFEARYASGPTWEWKADRAEGYLKNMEWSASAPGPR